MSVAVRGSFRCIQCLAELSVSHCVLRLLPGMGFGKKEI